MLDANKKKKGSWDVYGREFLGLMDERHIEDEIDLPFWRADVSYAARRRRIIAIAGLFWTTSKSAGAISSSRTLCDWLTRFTNFDWKKNQRALAQTFSCLL
ncbi:MAG TPA: hypothetical protein VNV43_08465 [Candidatus Acidoferrales bacterium]|jgi:hypothetical protein|nr:hypothetical protein [Candidatus Acidoferrales bacterium]